MKHLVTIYIMNTFQTIRELLLKVAMEQHVGITFHLFKVSVNRAINYHRLHCQKNLEEKCYAANIASS